MPDRVDHHAPRRAQLLVPVADLCGRAGLAVTVGEFRPRFCQPVLALRCAAADGSWDAAVTVVRASPVPPSADRNCQRYSRDPRTGYDLDALGELAYEVQIHEDDDDAGGHGPRPLVAFELVTTAQAAADVLTLWASRASLFRCEVPAVNPLVLMRWDRRCHEHRQSAAAAARVDVTPAARQRSPDVAAVDWASLCWHFPRERSGRYRRSAVVALAPCEDTLPHLRAAWLTATAEGDRLVLTVTDLKPTCQPHRWDLTPWLWDRRHAGTPPQTRWQVSRADEAAATFRVQRHVGIAEALTLAGVQTDEQIAALLAGRPARLRRSELTATWMSTLYAGLAHAAPWRLAAAHGSWRESREAMDLPTPRPVVLFGLGGMVQARKPKVALDITDDGPLLCLRFTGGNAVLPRSLWTLPPDLVAQFYGWRVAYQAGRH
jgi:hypothetical protein